MSTPEPSTTEPSTTEPTTKLEATEDVHTALDSVEEAFKSLYGKVSTEVKKLLGHLHNQADGLVKEGESDLDEDQTEAKEDVQTVTVTGQSALGGGVNPNAVTPTTPVPNIPVQQESTQVVPPTNLAP